MSNFEIPDWLREEFERWKERGGRPSNGLATATDEAGACTPTLAQRLAAPFPSDQIGWVAITIRGSRALVAPYLEVRTIEDRLDAVVGPGGWQESYAPLPGGAVMCRLAIQIGGQWITKSDVGCGQHHVGPAEPGLLARLRGRRNKEAPAGHLLKCAFTDALKRAAVKWGIGRYLGRALKVWVDWDPVTRSVREAPASVTFAGDASGLVRPEESASMEDRP